VTDEGSLVQKAGDWRPLARILFTLIGAALMILGATRDLATRPEGIDLSATQIAAKFRFQLIDPFAGFADFVSVGAAVIVLAIVMAFGLTGPSGRLTRLAAFVAAALVAAVYITLMFAPNVSAAPSGGAIVVILGCVLGYIGGLLVKR
jgi:hypothetical protein